MYLEPYVRMRLKININNNKNGYSMKKLANKMSLKFSITREQAVGIILLYLYNNPVKIKYAEGDIVVKKGFISKPLRIHTIRNYLTTTTDSAQIQGTRVIDLIKNLIESE